MKIEDIRELAKNPNAVFWSLHIAKRLVNRGISRTEVLECINKGTIIEDYPTAYPHPACLIYCNSGNNPLHVCVGSDGINLWIVTAYIPSLEKFMEDLKTRR